MSTLAVVEGVLREAEVPMSVREIVERAGDSLPTKSKTPDTVVARDLSMDIKKKGEASIFVRTAPGRYTMRELHNARLEQEHSSLAKQADAVADTRPSDGGIDQRPTELVSTAIGENPAPKGTRAPSSSPKAARSTSKSIVQPQQ